MENFLINEYKSDMLVVLVIKDNVAQDVSVFRKSELKEDLEELAIQAFLYLCKSFIWNFDSYRQEDINKILEIGMARFGDNNTIQILWV